MRSIGEVRRSETSKRRGESGGKFKNPTLSISWRAKDVGRKTIVAASVADCAVFFYETSNSRARCGHSSEPGCDGGYT